MEKGASIYLAERVPGVWYIGEKMSFNPPLLLKNKHLQSIIPSLKLRKPFIKNKVAPLLESSREVTIDCGEGVRLQGFYSPQNKPEKDLVILIHGWEGSNDSNYILTSAGRLYEMGYNIFRLNMRDHGTSHHLNEKLFNSCRLDEIVNAVANIQKNYANGCKTFLCGFSLGGNFSLRVAAKAHEANIPLCHVVAVCPVLKPESTLEAIDTGVFIYEKYFIRKWKKSLRIKEKLFPESFSFNDKGIYKNLTVMTKYFVNKYTKYPDIDTYLNGYAITGDRLKDLTVPSSIIISKDDPVIPYKDLTDIADSNNINIIDVPFGGHCGFVKNYSFESWADEKMLEIIQKSSIR